MNNGWGGIYSGLKRAEWQSWKEEFLSKQTPYVICDIESADTNTIH